MSLQPKKTPGVFEKRVPAERMNADKRRTGGREGGGKGEGRGRGR